MTDELKPCPHCGSKDIDPDCVGAVLCLDCGASAPSAERWNLRAFEPLSDEEILGFVDDVHELVLAHDPEYEGDRQDAEISIQRWIARCQGKKA